MWEVSASIEYKNSITNWVPSFCEVWVCTIDKPAQPWVDSVMLLKQTLWARFRILCPRASSENPREATCELAYSGWWNILRYGCPNKWERPDLYFRWVIEEIRSSV